MAMPALPQIGDRQRAFRMRAIIEKLAVTKQPVAGKGHQLGDDPEGLLRLGRFFGGQITAVIAQPGHAHDRRIQHRLARRRKAGRCRPKLSWPDDNMILADGLRYRRYIRTLW